jgi:glycosyltransferase involved in cell wall biosynthesis
MNKAIILTIVTPSFNQGIFIDQTIRSVIFQKGPFYIDYIIVDGNSTDHSVEIIKNNEQELLQHTQSKEIENLTFRVNIDGQTPYLNCLGVSYRWMSEPDKGQIDAITKGLKLAKGSLFAYLNSDDYYYPGTFYQVVKLNWRGIDFVYGKGMWVDVKSNDVLPYPTFKPSKYNFYYQCTLCQPTVFFTRQLYEQLGDFSQEYQIIFDYEYWMRAVFQNKRFHYINRFLAVSRVYFETKSMANKDKVSKEVPDLIHDYYHTEITFFNRWIYWFKKYTIHKKTHKQVNEMLAHLNADFRYEF